MCGLRTKSRLGILDKFVSDYDVIGLCETKCNSSDICVIPNFHPLVMSSKLPKHKFGAAHGICVYIRDGINARFDVIENTNSEFVFWLKASSISESFIIGMVYLPCESSLYHHSDIFCHISEDLANFRSDHNDIPIMLFGDFNSRTGILSDFIEPHDLVTVEGGFELSSEQFVNSEAIFNNAGIGSGRYSKDHIVNDNGLNLIELCKNFDIRIVNGRFGSDMGIGEFTCQNAKGSSVVDYVLVSSILMRKISDFHVYPLDKCLSDAHGAISVQLTFDTVQSRDAHPDGLASMENSCSLDENSFYEPLKMLWKKGSETA